MAVSGGPAGSVRALDPSPGRELSAWAVVAAAGLGAAGALVVATLAVRSARRAARQPVRRTAVRRPRRLAPRGGPPEVAEGIRAALGGSRGAHLLTAGCGLAVVALLAAIVFGASLSRALSTPATYGWPWDLPVMTGAGYGDLDLAATRPLPRRAGRRGELERVGDAVGLAASMVVSVRARRRDLAVLRRLVSPRGRSERPWGCRS